MWYCTFFLIYKTALVGTDLSILQWRKLGLWSLSGCFRPCCEWGREGERAGTQVAWTPALRLFLWHHVSLRGVKRPEFYKCSVTELNPPVPKISGALPSGCPSLRAFWKEGTVGDIRLNLSSYYLCDLWPFVTEHLQRQRTHSTPQAIGNSGNGIAASSGPGILLEIQSLRSHPRISTRAAVLWGASWVILMLLKFEACCFSAKERGFEVREI